MTFGKFLTTMQLCGALVAVPAGAAGVYNAYRMYFSTDTTCRVLRSSIMTALDRNVDANARRALIRQDLAEFERSCALNDPEASAVFAAIDAKVSFASKPETDEPPARLRSVRHPPPPPPPEWELDPAWKPSAPHRPFGI